MRYGIEISNDCEKICDAIGHHLMVLIVSKVDGKSKIVPRLGWATEYKDRQWPPFDVSDEDFKDLAGKGIISKLTRFPSGCKIGWDEMGFTDESFDYYLMTQ